MTDKIIYVKVKGKPRGKPFAKGNTFSPNTIKDEFSDIPSRYKRYRLRKQKRKV